MLHFFFLVGVQLLQHRLLRKQFLLHWNASALLSKLSYTFLHIFMSLIYISISPTLHCHEYCSYQIRSDQLLSRVRLFETTWITARQASLSITNSRSSLRLTSSESVMPSSHLILCRPLLLLPPIPPSIRLFSNESTLCMRWPKYWSFSFSIIPSKEIPGLIIWSCNSTPGHKSRENYNSNRCVHSNVHCRSLYNSQYMEATQISIDIWMDKKMWYIYTMEYYSVIKRMKLAATWMDLEIVILSEVSQTEKDKYHMMSYVSGV